MEVQSDVIKVAHVGLKGKYTQLLRYWSL